MREVLSQLSHSLPWLDAAVGELGDKRFRKLHSLPSISLNCKATKHRYLALYPEPNSIWTIIVFTSNGMGSANFHKRISRPRAKFAVYSFFLEELAEALEQTLGTGFDRDEPSGRQRDLEIQQQLKLVRAAIKNEAAVEHEPETFRFET